MKIDNLKVSNWRSVRNLDVSFQDMMILIGQNNCGKSNILYSLLYFFGQIKATEQDFCHDCEDLFVEVKFKDLDDQDKHQFKKYLDHEGNIIVRKQQNIAGGFSYHGYLNNPTLDWLKEENIANYSKREIAVTLPINEYLPAGGRITKDIYKAAIESYVEANSENLEFVYELENGPFLGLKSVAQSIFGEIYFVPAVKNASDDWGTKSNALFNKLYSSVIKKLATSNQQYIEAKSSIEGLINNLNRFDKDGNANTARPPEISNLESKLHQNLSSWNTQVEIEVTPPNIEEIFRTGTNIWVNDGIRTDISRKGHGLQRTMIFALIQAYSSVLEEEREKEIQKIIEETGHPPAPSGRRSSNSTYFIFEEPELYLHPQGQKELFASLKALSEGGNQIVIATHSSHFIDLNVHDSINIVRKTSEETGSVITECPSNIFTDHNDKQQFSIIYYLNPDRSEIFFASKVILLEGQTDKTVIPYLAKKLEIYRHDYTVIDCGGKGSIPLYIRLLNSFRIPYVAVYDLDHHNGKNQNALNAADDSTARIDALIDAQIGSKIVFHNDIEEEIGYNSRSHSKAHIALQAISEPGYNIPDQLEAKIRLMYE